jgi:site-specific DNA recombinase
VNAGWLENLVWSDVRRFLENPGEVLDAVKAQLEGEDGATDELERRREDLARRLSQKTAEKDRYVRLYAQSHISESELEVYLADLKNQTENLRLLIGSVEADLSQRAEQKELAESTYAWLLTLRERISEVEKDIEEAFQVRRRLVRLLVAGVTTGRNDLGSTEVRITYRFDPPDKGTLEDGFVGSVLNDTSLSKAKQATAPAVCGPTPGSFSSVSGSDGISPPCSSTTMRAVRCRLTTRL